MTRYVPILAGCRRVNGFDFQGCEVDVLYNGSVVSRLKEVGLGFGVPPLGWIRRLNNYQPRILHAHFGFDAVRALPIQIRLRCPMVVTFHGYDVSVALGSDGGPSDRIYRRRLPGLVASSAVMLAVSEFVRGRLLTLGVPEDKVITHYIGVDTTSFQHQGRRLRQPIVLAVGRLVEKKGFGHLIRAVGGLQRAGHDVRLVVVGEGPLEGVLKRQAARELNAYEFLGALPRDGVRTQMAHARVLAVPSVTAENGDTEGLPITLLEGCASGLPVVASNHAGIPEVVRDGVTGLLVEEGNANGIGRSIQTLFEDDDVWDRISAEARNQVERRFDLSRQTARLEDIYDSVLSPAAVRGLPVSAAFGHGWRMK